MTTTKTAIPMMTTAVMLTGDDGGGFGLGSGDGPGDGRGGGGG
jgi:hypothetical protein